MEIEELDVFNTIYDTMRNIALFPGFYFGLFGGIIAILMDLDHIIPSMARRTHFYVVLAFLILSIGIGIVIWALV